MASSEAAKEAASCQSTRPSRSRAALGVAMPRSETSDFSSSTLGAGGQKRKCKHCQRDDQTPNPIVRKRQESPTLQFSRAFGRECSQCHKYIAVAWKGKSGAQLETFLKDPSNKEAYMKGLMEYEAMLNDSNKSRAPRGGIAPLTFVSTVQEQAFATEENLGVLWPVAIYEEKHGKAPAKKIITIDHQGKGVRGIVLDEGEFGCPIGCIRLKGTSSHIVQKTTRQESSDQQVRKGQLGDTWKAVQGMVRVEASSRKREGDEAPGEEVVLKAPKLLKKKEEGRGGRGGRLRGLLGRLRTEDCHQGRRLWQRRPGWIQ